jgi:hypothetical protein
MDKVGTTRQRGRPQSTSKFIAITAHEQRQPHAAFSTPCPSHNHLTGKIGLIGRTSTSWMPVMIRCWAWILTGEFFFYHLLTKRVSVSSRKMATWQGYCCTRRLRQSINLVTILALWRMNPSTTEERRSRNVPSKITI